MSCSHRESLSRGDRLLNDILTVPKDVLVGFVYANPHLGLLAIGNTIVRRDYDAIKQVKLVSGGPTGHEPLYSGFVGKGMLTAAIQGDVCNSPSVYDIVNVIKELAHHGNYGILVIIQNNIGDMLNFGLAIEKARSVGINVKIIIVSDDCSVQTTTNKTDAARGLTGVVLIQKIAGALAEEGKLSCTEIHNYCEEIAKRLTTVMLTLKAVTAESDLTCICMKNPKNQEAEIGGGLHGERGTKKIKISSTDYVVNELLHEISKNIVYDDNSPFVLLINNFCVTKLEENIFIGEVVRKLLDINIKLARIYVGTVMTSLDMKGFTLTILKADAAVIEFLDYPTDAPNWNFRNIGWDANLSVTINPTIRLTKHPKIIPQGPNLSDRESNILLLVIQFACDALISCERQLNIMDGESGDGDTGSRLKVVAANILDGIKQDAINLQNVYAFFKTMGRVSDRIGGTMGAIYGIVFEASATILYDTDENDSIDIWLWFKCLTNSIKALQCHTKCEDGSNNMLGPLIACAEVIERAKDDDGDDEDDVIGVCGNAVTAAELAAQRTKQQNDRKHPDPGAHAVGIWMRAIYEGVKFRCTF